MRIALLAITLLSLALSNLCAQTDPRTPLDLVNYQKKIGETFPIKSLFSIAQRTEASHLKLDKEINEYTLLDVNLQLLQQIKGRPSKTMHLQIPLSFARNLELDLVLVDILAEDFSVVQRSDNSVADVETGVHYRGIISGDEHSIVALSIYEQEVIALVSSKAGNIVVGRLQDQNGTSKHIAYDDLPVFQGEAFACGTEDSGIGYKRKDLDFHHEIESRDVGDCIRLYIEVDKDIHDNKGGVAGATNYITGLLNQVITLYANENLETVVSQIVVWDVTSPYSSTSSSGMLSDFENHITSINGDLGQLLSYQASGGIAYVNGLCRSNVDYRLSFSSIGSSYAVVPTYSWSVMVIAHEFGHLFGSQHTHACVWNGNSTAIDGCAGSTEGSCALPGNPSQGGTIMSYCHLQSVGINFNEGFGPQPGNVIRNRVANASCLSSCGPPTCEDGIQNGDEEGVDCGGSSCSDCPSCDDGIQNGDEQGIDCGGSNCAPCPCEGASLTLTLKLDNYPEETSWEIRSATDVVASGGTYGSEPDLSTITANFCLPEGCYNFIIFDSFGDGICCSYGNGNYSLKNNDTNEILASGGDFNFSESTNFCLNQNSEPKCDDGIQNGQETGVDCGGPDCVPCACDIPSGLAATPSEETASLNWSTATGASSYNIRARQVGSNTWSTGSDLTPPVNYTGLSACTNYEYQVQSNCDGNNSEWSSSYSFTTTGCVVPSCDDGLQNGDETGVDCGGPDCPDCPTCDDGIHNGAETGVDCGGPDCPDCPNCSDGVQNGAETGVDCGGPDCPDCPTCSDGVQNGAETGVDCGGPDCPDCPTCGDGIQNGAETGVDCGGPDCPDCPTCGDGIQNGAETGVDCGGPDCPDCPTCGDGIQNGAETGVDCGGPDCPDCPSCSDGVQNGAETGVDCGGPDCPDCPVDPTCDDGIQNGDETGIDCGGSACDPCVCTGVQVTLTILLDNFPQETSWELRQDNSVIAQGGTYGHLPDRSTVTEEFCLADGCYDLVFYDSYGDGICCTYGEGFYQLTQDSDGTVLAEGSNFGSVNTTNFCLGAPNVPTCEDGFQNGDETGIDCGGEQCPACPTEPSCDDGFQNGDETGVDCGGAFCPECPPVECEEQLINFNNFDNSWGIWNDGGSDCRRASIDAPYASGGVGKPVRLRDNSNSSHTTTDNLDLSHYEEITLIFTYLARSMDNPNEDFWLQISLDGGETFGTVEEWNRGDEFENNIRYYESVTIPGPFTATTKLRFYCDASTNSDYVYLDDIEITGCYLPQDLPEGPSKAVVPAESAPVAVGGINVFPNPVREFLSVNFELDYEANAQIVITDLQGRTIKHQDYVARKGANQTTFKVGTYIEGIYVLHLITSKERRSKKFVLIK